MNINEDLKHSIVLKIDMCAECNFDKEVAIINDIIKELEREGLDIKTEFLKNYGIVNELVIHLIKHDGSKIIIYSNNKMNENQGALYSHKLTPEIGKEILNKILKEK